VEILTFEDYLKADNVRMYAAICRIRQLHKPAEYNPTVCVECTRLISYQRPLAEAQYPCPTIQALNGETQ
jgi:hypothetical protein